MLKDLGWSTFEERRDFLLAVLMYKCHHGTAPTNLTDKLCLQSQISERVSRHIDESTYYIPKTRIKTTDAAFMTQGPTVWNRIPQHIRDATSIDNFKKHYKKDVLGLDVKMPREQPTS